ncbi:MAG: hypothetical protein QN122_12785 [Armatimonadota bacterium]|nr:hypothetical protein [Armatimonadota bacterium]MDR7480268.1 hypothetical protein [Armatimonadota bacterium]MDR7488703.1 hypothetical protein [Armatimonadota bacterium]MDR7492312.1 hypothetical protein [Armatimonadota bacterium]MDR7502735.1 hypothetical protein [Armatimonadota bacterium]
MPAPVLCVLGFVSGLVLVLGGVAPPSGPALAPGQPGLVSAPAPASTPDSSIAVATAGSLDPPPTGPPVGTRCGLELAVVNLREEVGQTIRLRGTVRNLGAQPASEVVVVVTPRGRPAPAWGGGPSETWRSAAGGGALPDLPAPLRVAVAARLPSGGEAAFTVDLGRRVVRGYALHVEAQGPPSSWASPAVRRHLPPTAYRAWEEEAMVYCVQVRTEVSEPEALPRGEFRRAITLRVVPHCPAYARITGVEVEVRWTVLGRDAGLPAPRDGRVVRLRPPAWTAVVPVAHPHPFTLTVLARVLGVRWRLAY